jgi:hypothetical protein
MAIVNQYKAVYPIENTKWENNFIYINATSMQKAIEMLNIQYGSEPTCISEIRKNVLTEVTLETTVSVNANSYYIDENENEIEIPLCVVYPSELTNVQRGNTIYFTAPNYDFDETYGEYEGKWKFVKWIYNNEDITDNPYVFTTPLDESIGVVNIKVIYEKVTD